jgi:hypothetical protein
MNLIAKTFTYKYSMQMKYLFILFIIINFYIIFIFLIHSCQNYQLMFFLFKLVFKIIMNFYLKTIKKTFLVNKKKKEKRHT